MDPLELGTLYQSLERAVARYGERAAYAVPPMKGRPYHPEGREFTWAETWAAVQARKAHYAAAGYGPGHRVAILFDQRPEFIFHHFALNALGCSTVPISPDYLGDEIAYLLDHSEACLALAIEPRLGDVRGAAGGLRHAHPRAALRRPVGTAAASSCPGRRHRPRRHYRGGAALHLGHDRAA